ncbi:MAG: replicative DNA helicase [Chromatiales bacterium]|jgi:replicative DNA helicase|nr:replicative DNA helicase [Chromatiales bacterium]
MKLMAGGEPTGRATDALRIPPHSIEAEQAVLGGLMLDSSAWETVADRVTEEDFYRHEHRLIFRAIGALCTRNDPVDVVTVSEWLAHQKILEEAGGFSYLAEMVGSTPSAANIRTYAGIVRERSVLRQLIHVGTEIGNSAFMPEGRDCAEIIDNAERLVYAIAEQGRRNQRSFRPVKDLLVDVTERIDKLYHNSGAYTGTPTGFSDFDEKTSGLQETDLIIIAGRPSMGKTSFAMNIAEHAAIKSNVPVAVFSMEMQSEQLVTRLLSSLGRIDQQIMRTGKLRDEDWPRLTSAMSLLSEAPLFIDDTPALSPTEMRARARRIDRELKRTLGKGLGLIVIDYLQLMQVPGFKENRTNEISEISRSLKALAKELSVPVIALSQLNRSLEQRPNKRPVMSDLRESGAIEQDADLIAFIYRDEVYHEDTPDKGIAEVIIGKQRNGPTGIVKLTFLGQYTRFENHASDGYRESYS